MTDSVDETLTPTPIKETFQDADPGASSKAAKSCERANPQKVDVSTRYIPEHKKHDAALTFPEKVGSKIPLMWPCVDKYVPSNLT